MNSKLLRGISNYTALIITFVMLFNQNDLLFIFLMVASLSVCLSILYGLYFVYVVPIKNHDHVRNRQHLNNKVLDDVNLIVGNSIMGILMGIGAYMIASYFLI